MLDLNHLHDRFGYDITESTYRDNRRIIVPSEKVYFVLEHLWREGGFDMLAELTAADYLDYPNATDRFGVMYVLLNTTTGERVIVKTFLNPPELELPSVFPLWKSADWLEREVYDMFGIVFTGHSNLKRLLLPEEWQGYPLRKDYDILQQDEAWVRENLGIESGQ